MVPKVTYTDEGTYTQRDFWNNEISTVKVAVTRELSFFSVDDNNFYFYFYWLNQKFLICTGVH